MKNRSPIVRVGQRNELFIEPSSYRGDSGEKNGAHMIENSLKGRNVIDIFRTLALLLIFLSSPSLSFTQIQPLTVGYASLTGPPAILHVIKEANIFRKYGLDVRPVLIAGGSRAVMALIAGDFKVLFTSAAAIVNPVARGADIVIIAGIANKLDYSFFASPEMKVPMDLKGQTIAISQPGTSGDFFARYLLVRWGLTPDRDVAMLPIGTQPDRFRALQTGRVKATMLQVPNTAIARKMGFAELARADEVDLEYQGSVVTSTRFFLSAHADVTRRFMKALVEGIHYYKGNRQPALTSISKFLRLPDAELAAEVYNLYSKLVSPLPYPTLKGIQTILEEGGKKDAAVAQLKTESLIDARILDEIANEGFVSRLYQNVK